MNESPSADLAADTAIVFPLRHRVAAYGVHCYTALGLLCGALAAANILQADNRTAFLWMIVAVLIDATDGTLARRLRVKEAVPHIDGRKLDDIVDYLNYTFLPLLLIGWAGWLPEPVWLWASIPLIASVFAFSHTGAKEEHDGFFLGFPSYWNIFAFYVAVWLRHYGDYVVLGVALVLSLLSVLPVRFIYPNRPPRWKGFFLGGATVTLGLAVLILLQYPEQNGWLVAMSLVYPAAYVVLSVYLDLENRRERRAAAAGALAEK
jgi:phosphatidylcholine synthase